MAAAADTKVSDVKSSGGRTYMYDDGSAIASYQTIDLAAYSEEPKACDRYGIDLNAAVMNIFDPNVYRVMVVVSHPKNSSMEQRLIRTLAMNSVRKITGINLVTSYVKSTDYLTPAIAHVKINLRAGDTNSMRLWKSLKSINGKLAEVEYTSCESEQESDEEECGVCPGINDEPTGRLLSKKSKDHLPLLVTSTKGVGQLMVIQLESFSSNNDNKDDEK